MKTIIEWLHDELLNVEDYVLSAAIMAIVVVGGVPCLVVSITYGYVGLSLFLAAVTAVIAYSVVVWIRAEMKLRKGMKAEAS